MKIYILLLLLNITLNIVTCISNNESNSEKYYKWDDARINPIGNGFDILESTEREAIFVLNSIHHSDPSKPILTRTLPKGTIMRDINKDIFQFYAEVISKNINIKDSRDIKVSGHVGFADFGGSFSEESKIVKQWISYMNHKVTRVNSFIVLSDINLQTTGLNISEGLYSRIHQVRNLLNKNTEISKCYATYIIDEILNLYGTHVIIDIKLGGIISKIDAIDISTYTSNTDQSLSASASASFASYFNIKGSITTEHTDIVTYSKSISNSYITTLGGDPWTFNSTYTSWVDSTFSKPSIIGMRLISILDIIREQYFNNISFVELMNIKENIINRLNVYYMNNRYIGCSNPTASNYVEYVNVYNDSLCNYQYTFHFGGLFTTSNDPSFNIANMLTNELSCPDGFEVHPLLTTQFPKGTQVCFKFLWMHHCYNIYNTIETTTYTCISSKNQTKGMYFGGIYTTNIPNDITQDKSCPIKYIPYPIYHDINRQYVTYICISPYDIGEIITVPFGGLFSYQYPNYMVDNLPICGGGFERHPVGENPISELTYCIGLGSLKNKRKDIIPPGYNDAMICAAELYPIYKFENGSLLGLILDPLSNKTYPEQIIYKLKNEQYKFNDINIYMKILSQYNDNTNNQSNNVELIISLSILLPIIIIIVISVIIYFIIKHRRERSGYSIL